MTYLNAICTAAAVAALGAGVALADGADNDPGHDGPAPSEMLKEMQEQHADHEHGHDFEVLEDISEEDMRRTMDFLVDIGLVVPAMDSRRGRTAFVEKGCIVCHAVNGVGGEIGPAFDARNMPQPMNAFDFAARMWRGAPAMAQMQEDLMGEMIALDGQELADLVAFVHDEEAQSTLSAAEIPERFKELLP